MTFSNGTKWDHEVGPAVDARFSAVQRPTVDELPRLDDGRWTPMPVVAQVEVPPRQPEFQRPLPRNEATTQLAVTNSRMPQEAAVWGADPRT